MKTNTINLILTTIVMSAISLAAATRVNASNLPIIATTVSYVAVAVLVALAAIDYRSGPKSYLTR